MVRRSVHLLVLALALEACIWSPRLLPQEKPDAESQIEPGRILSQPPPVYPKEARKKHIEGVVVLRADIGVDGIVQKLEVVSGDPVLVPAALDAVRKWRYSPALLNGKPVSVTTTLHVTFKLNPQH